MSTPFDSESEIKSLIAALESDDGLARERARRSLVAIGKPAVAALINALGNAKRTVRWEAAKALGEIKDPQAAPVLVRALEDVGIGVRWLAAEALIGLGRDGLAPLLQALVHHSGSIWLQQGAHHVLRTLSKQDLPKVVEPVLQALEDIEPVIQVPPAAQAALEALDTAG